MHFPQVYDLNLYVISKLQILKRPVDYSQPGPCVGFSRQQYWSGLPSPSPEDLPDPGMEPLSPTLRAHQAVLWAPAPRRRLREAPGCSERCAVCSCRAWWGPDLPELSLRRADAHGLTRMGPSSVPPRHLRAPTIRGIFLRGLRATPSRGSLRKASWASGPGGGRALTQQLPASDAAPLQSRDRPWRCLLPPPVPSKAPSPG